MKKFDILKTADNMAAKLKFEGTKYAPEILVGIGLIAGVAACVKAVTATPKAMQIIEDAKAEADIYEEVREEEPEKYSDADLANDKRMLAIKTSAKVAASYAPAIILGVVSIMSILASHGLLRKRNAVLSAAYMTLDKSFSEYRDRVKKAIGAEDEAKLMHGIHEEVTEEVIKDPVTGEEKTVTKTKTVADSCSPYARMFSKDTSIYWDRDPFHNKFHISGVQMAANDRLRAHGHLFLNEVYDMLGLDRTEAGQYVGWIYDKNAPYGDNYVDFGLSNDAKDELTRDFVAGLEPDVLLDFNVAGDIVSIMKQRKMIDKI